MSSRAKQGLPPRNRAHQDNVVNGNRRLGQIAASQWGLVRFRKGEKSVEEKLDPSLTAAA